MILGGTVISSVEFSGKISLVIFLAKCPLRCNYCHNSEILDKGYEISNEELFKIIYENSSFIDAVVVSGGEPLLQIEPLIEILKYSRKIGLKTKLDTSGCYPERLEKVIDLIDYVSIDIKAPFDKYGSILLNKSQINQIKEMKDSNNSKSNDDNNDKDKNKENTNYNLNKHNIKKSINSNITTINTIIDSIDDIDNVYNRDMEDIDNIDPEIKQTSNSDYLSENNIKNEDFSNFIEDYNISSIGKKVKKSIEIANKKDNLVLECRTTYVPTILIHEDITTIVKALKCDIYTIQQFRNKNVLNPELENIENPNPRELREIAKKISAYQKNIMIKTAEFGVETL